MKSRLVTSVLILQLFSTAAPCQYPDAIEPVRVGRFQLTLTIPEAVGADSARAVETIIAPDEPVTWNVFVPESYRPQNPAGLIVYISPTQSGEIPPSWKFVMEELNLIWIAAKHSGNTVPVARRAAFALVAPTLAGKYYEIDQERIYLSGFSGGARVASMIAANYPQLFKGGIYNCGANFWDQHPPAQPGLIRQNHYVFITGTKDQALRPVKKVHQQFLDSGVTNSKLMVIRRMAHENPGRSDFAEAVRYLDTRITR